MRDRPATAAGLDGVKTDGFAPRNFPPFVFPDATVTSLAAQRFTALHILSVSTNPIFVIDTFLAHETTAPEPGMDFRAVILGHGNDPLAARWPNLETPSMNAEKESKAGRVSSIDASPNQPAVPTRSQDSEHV